MKYLSIIATLAVAAGLASGASAAVETYKIDPVHSSVGFTIRHFVSKVPGRFTKVTGTLALDRDNLEASTVQATIDAGSLSTANDKRDAHVKSGDFLNVASFPTIAFASKSWKKTGDDTYDVTGDVTLHGTTKEVVLHAHLLGFGQGMQGVQICGWEAEAVLKKSDFGVVGPAMLGKVLGDDVAVAITVEADQVK